MKLSICFFLLLVATYAGAGGQTTDTVDRIDRDLATLDLAPFEWEGEPDPASPRLGIYLNAIPEDSVRAVTGRDANPPWYVIWHAMPHWSADEAGVLIGDTLTALVYAHGDARLRVRRNHARHVIPREPWRPRDLGVEAGAPTPRSLGS